ncbi:MAG: hypothetical protein ABSH47_21330 [Bryobacteraceae bacterium]
MPTHLTESVEHDSPAAVVQQVRQLIHELAFGFGACRTRWQQSASRQIVAPVNGTCLIAVQVSAVARKGNEVPHGRSFALAHPLPYGRGSVTVAARLRSRLGYDFS